MSFPRRLDALLVTPAANERSGSRLRRSCRVQKIKAHTCVEDSTLFFELLEVPDALTGPEEDDADTWLRATLLEAMAHRAELRIEGKVSRRLLENLREFQGVWSCWLNLPPVALRVQGFRQEREPERHRAVCSFSGGVDSLFTAMVAKEEFQRGLVEHRTDFCVYAHGFDLPLAEEGPYRARLQRNRALAEKLGLQLLPMRTNIRQISRVDWGWLHGIATVAALSSLSPLVDTCLIPSTYSYRDLAPWGSHPLSDPLAGSRDFRVIHHGAAFERLEKIRWVASRDESVLCHLSVCNQPTTNGANCGVCEKCLRTRTAMDLLDIKVADGLFESAVSLEDSIAVITRRIEGHPLRIAPWRLLHRQASAAGPRFAATRQTLERILSLVDQPRATP